MVLGSVSHPKSVTSGASFACEQRIQRCCLWHAVLPTIHEHATATRLSNVKGNYLWNRVWVPRLHIRQATLVEIIQVQKLARPLWGTWSALDSWRGDAPGQPSRRIVGTSTKRETSVEFLSQQETSPTIRGLDLPEPLVWPWGRLLRHGIIDASNLWDPGRKARA